MHKHRSSLETLHLPVARYDPSLGVLERILHQYCQLPLAVPGLLAPLIPFACQIELLGIGETDLVCGLAWENPGTA